MEVISITEENLIFFKSNWKKRLAFNPPTASCLQSQFLIYRFCGYQKKYLFSISLQGIRGETIQGDSGGKWELEQVFYYKKIAIEIALGTPEWWEKVKPN